MIVRVNFTVFLCSCNALSLISIADPFLLARPNLLFTGLKLNVLGYTWLHCQAPQFFDESEVGDLIKTLVQHPVSNSWCDVVKCYYRDPQMCQKSVRHLRIMCARWV